MGINQLDQNTDEPEEKPCKSCTSAYDCFTACQLIYDWDERRYAQQQKARAERYKEAGATLPKDEGCGYSRERTFKGEFFYDPDLPIDYSKSNF